MKFWPVWSYLAGTPWGHARAKPEDVLTLVQVVTSASTLPLSARRGGTARAPLSTIPLFMPYVRLPHTVLHSRLFLTPRRGRGPLSGTAALRAGLPPQCQRTQLVAVAPAEVAPWRRASNAIPPAGGTFGNKVSTGTTKQCSAWGKVGLPPCEVACGALPLSPRLGDAARAPRGTFRWRRPRIPGDPSYLRQHPRSQG